MSQFSVSRNNCRGFTYIGLLLLVVMMGVLLATTGKVWHQVQQHDKEQELMFIGNQFRMAINAYYQNPPPGQANQFPKKLEDMVEDKRLPSSSRYLRKIFHDPFTGKKEWGLLKSADNGIIGVYSLSELEPLKVSNFNAGFEQLEGKKHYSDWQFVYNAVGAKPIVLASVPGAVTPPSQPDVPPEYRPPAHEAPPADRKHAICQLIRNGDLQTCAMQAQKFGANAGSACLGSAATRFDNCLNNGPQTSLKVQY